MSLRTRPRWNAGSYEAVISAVREKLPKLDAGSRDRIALQQGLEALQHERNLFLRNEGRKS